MYSLSCKIGVCLLGGLLFFVSGCGATTLMNHPPSARAGVESTPTAASGVAGQVVLVSTAILTPSPTPTSLPGPDPTASPTRPVEAMPIPTPSGPPFSYHVISEGETLSYISLLYDTPIEQLVAMNNLSGPAALIQAGQSLRVPVQTKNVAPVQMLLPDSEVVYSPAYVDFDIAGFINSRGGYLSTYHEYVDHEELSGAEIIEQVAEQFSVGPRLLLALLEHYGGWVTQPQPSPTQLSQPLGPHNPRGDNLYLALGFTANRINAGYYGYKRDGFWIFDLADRNQAITPQGFNAGTVGLQNILAVYSDWDTWGHELGPDGFMVTYRALFGDPMAYVVEPVVPITLTQPPLALPWAGGQGFYFSGGSHPAYADGSAWAAVDFGPPDVLGNCFYSNEPSTAAAPGVIVVARQGEVDLDLDGDGQIQTGWVLLYLHVALDFDTPVQVGQRVAQGDVIGYASCEGGLSNSSHLHFARRYNGEWIEAGGPVPLNLDGWVVQHSLVPYEGLIIKGTERREACQCWDADQNLIVNRSPD